MRKLKKNLKKNKPGTQHQVPRTNYFKRNKKGLYELKPKNQSGKDSFFDLTGIWEGRDIDINSIRAEAWPNRK